VQLGLPANSALSSIGGIVASICVQARLLVQLTTHGSGMMGSIFKQDKAAFLKNWASAVAISGVCAVMEQVSSHFQSNLEMSLRTNLSKNFHTRLLANNNFYKISQLDGRITDSAQRIADDVRDFSSTASGIIAEFLKPVVELGLFAMKLRTLVGSFATSVLLGYLVTGAYIIRSVLPNFKKFVAEEAEADGKYMAVHARVKTHCESIAFFGGDSREKAIVTKEFDSVSKLAFHRLKVSLSFGVVNQAIVRETPMLVQWLLRNEFGKRAGSDASVLADQGQSLNGNMLFIYEAVMYSFDSLSKLLEFLERFSNFSGLVTRVAELDEVLTEMDASVSTSAGTKNVVDNAEKKIKFDGIDIVTPSGNVLAKKVSIEVEPGQSLMVTGPNACGKTSFFRVLGGLWPVSSGTLSIPTGDNGTPEIEDVFLVPQRMYMVLGSLADQLTYPRILKQGSSELQAELPKLQGLLDLVGVGYLSGRQWKWVDTVRWEDVLSLGEQQRIGMARLFYHSPQYGVLDECTSAVSVDVEDRLYREAARLNITCITLSQRLALAEFHTQELQLGQADSETGNSDGWSIRALEAAEE